MAFDRNATIVLIFAAGALLMLGWLSSEVWYKRIAISETMTGAIIGGFLAGLFGLLAAGYSIHHNQVERDRRKNETEEVLLHSIVTKLIDLNDTVVKNRRHLMIDDASSRLSFGSSGKRYFFSILGVLGHPNFDGLTWRLRPIQVRT
jgi:hypothetical protein